MTLYISVGVLLQLAWTALIGGQRALFTVAMASAGRAQEIASLLKDGVITTVERQTFPLEEIVDAHTLAQRWTHGDIIINMQSE